MAYVIYTTRPVHYENNGLRVAGCCIILADKVLLICRGTQGNFAGEYEIPGGKIEAEETAQEAAIREVVEETGINVRNAICFAGTIYMAPAENPQAIDFAFHIFKAVLSERPSIILESSHTNFQWITPSEALLLPCIVGTREAFTFCNLI